VVRLATALGAATDAAAINAFRTKIAEDDLHVPGNVPVWLAEVLDALADGRHIPEWQPFDASTDLTDSLNFFRTLDQVLPVQIIDVGDNYTAIAPEVGLEAVITLVGHGYCVRPVHSAR